MNRIFVTKANLSSPRSQELLKPIVKFNRE